MEIRVEHRRVDQSFPDTTSAKVAADKMSLLNIWCRHEKLLTLSPTTLEI